MKYLASIKVWIGNTQELLMMREEGSKIQYGVGGSVWDVVYTPRNAHDPMPWLQVGGAGFRFRSSEIHAVSLCENGQDRSECTEIDPCETCEQDLQDEAEKIERSMGLR